MDEPGFCLLININHEDHRILPEILDRSNCLEEGTLKPVNGGYLIPLDTKYYSAQMMLQVFTELEAASQWLLDNHKSVCALLINCHIAQTFAKLLSQVRQLCRQIETGTKALLLGGNCSAFGSQLSFVQHFCSSESIEQIELAPNKETQDLLKEYHEHWGIDRVWEVLESVDWPCRQLKANPTNLPAHRQRLQHQIEGLDRQQRQEGMQELDEEDDEFRDPDLPDSEDEAAILEVFDKFNFGLARMIDNNYNLNTASCDDSNSNLQTNVKLSSASTPKNSIVYQSSTEDSKKGKKKKSSKSKGKSPPEDGEETSSTALGHQYSDGNFLSDILDNVLKTSSNQDFKASSFDPTELDWGVDDFSSVIGHLSELKEKGAALHRNERVSMAEKVSYSLLQKLGVNEAGDGKEERKGKKLEQEEQGNKKTV